mmetsp:Transcript_44364/g.78327  ORF Transcript_44364/g.78327 Transcript_44364/m.78327 type:complete len:204 (-) Transcript_44364:414-1025(-)
MRLWRLALLLTHQMSAHCLRTGAKSPLTASRAVRVVSVRLCGAPLRRSFWNVLMHGTQGKAAANGDGLCGGGGCRIHDLKKVFEQWDVDGSGFLELEELQRGFLAAGIEPDNWASVFTHLANGDERITFEEFEKNLSAGQRAAIEAKLNEEGVMRSLYVPPEKWADVDSQAESQWEQKVKFQAQQSGNQVRQNEILSRHLGAQ